MQVHLLQVSCQLYLYRCQVCSIQQSHMVAYQMLRMCSQYFQAPYNVPAFRLCHAAYHWEVHACMACAPAHSRMLTTMQEPLSQRAAQPKASLRGL